MQVAVCYPLVVGPWSTAEWAVLMVVALVGPSDTGHDLSIVGIGHFGDGVQRFSLVHLQYTPAIFGVQTLFCLGMSQQGGLPRDSAPEVAKQPPAPSKKEHQ